MTHLRRTKDFQALYRSGRSFRSNTLRVIATASPTTDHRLGIVVSVKISKRSTQRNRLRRVIREQINKWMKELDGVPPLDIAVVMTRLPVDETQLRNNLEYCFRAMIRFFVCAMR